MLSVEDVLIKVETSKILLTFLTITLFSFGANSESYICAFQCYGSNEVCQSTYTRTKNGFNGKWNKFSIMNENQNFVSLAGSASMPEILFVAIIDKQNLTFVKSTVKAKGGTNFRNGKCTIVR